jgi:hypothetical protein
MVDVKSVHAQLKRINFSVSAWGQAEIRELPNILHPDEKIYECVNGIYDGGFALLVATDMRVLLVDKKPLNYLTVEDLRFDMINEIDYSHRLMGAKITISAGNKTLNFRSYNQGRLRKLIGHVQDRMSELKREATEHQENQKQHLAQINQQLQSYMLAQHQQLLNLRQSQAAPASNDVPRPSPELSDYLFAQSLLAQFGGDLPQLPAEPEQATASIQTVQASEKRQERPEPVVAKPEPAVDSDDLWSEGYQEVFGKATRSPEPAKQEEPSPLASYLELPDASQAGKVDLGQIAAKSLEINPLKIASAKLPMMMRNRKFGRPSFHAHSQAEGPTQAPQTAPPSPVI